MLEEHLLRDLVGVAKVGDAVPLLDDRDRKLVDLACPSALPAERLPRLVNATDPVKDASVPKFFFFWNRNASA